MAQNWADDVFAGGHVGQTDLQNMENNFACLKSMFSGGSAPSNTIAGMPWFDTTQKVLKYRDSANAAWLGLMHGDTNQKVWVYRDSAMDGWAVDSSITDLVLAIKGGSTYTSGGATAGNWSITGLSDNGHTHGAGSYTVNAHNHQWYNEKGNNGWDDSYNSAGDAQGIQKYGPKSSSRNHLIVSDSTTDYYPQDLYTNNASPGLSGTSGTGNASISSNATWRPAAAVGTLQYLDL
ncbi:MAG: hypothetical protein JRH08_00740 [Deltaproteobacteria bacterium]|nr:hypothetical protein [Deltaproteobacteria bacterium]MBW2124230.1 hypothetical protein [Deltaproteobacteria bacterium]